MRTGSSVRAAGFLVGLFCALLGLCALFALVAFDDGDAHVRQHGHDVFDLLGGHLLGRQDRVEFVIGDIAARFRGLDQPLDSGVGQIQQRAVLLGRLGILACLLFVLRLDLGGLFRHGWSTPWWRHSIELCH
jgi:hypothetical protein